MMRILCLLAVVALASVVRLDGLGRPGTYAADEGYYARDACWYVHHSRSLCGISAEQTPEHPPLGKWLIGLGIRVFGFTPRGWRMASAIAGIATVAVLFALAWELLASTAAATLAAGLLAVEPLSVVQSRLATLDVFVTFFSVAAVWCFVRDRSTGDARLLAPWRVATGLCAGAAVASKWSGVLALALVIGLSLVAGRRRLRAEVAPILVCLVVVPVVVYCLTYAGRLPGHVLALPWAHGSYPRALLHRTRMMWDSQTGRFGISAYQSRPWTWPLLQRPALHYASVSGGRIREILGIGSPLIWWSGFIAAVAACVHALRWRDWDGPALVVGAAVAVSYLPWLFLAGGRSFVFIYYMTPVVPFLCLAIGWGVAQLHGRLRLVGPALAVASVLLLVFWWPVLTAEPVSFEAWRERVVVHGCRSDRQPPRLPSGDERAWVRLLRGAPPSGWCWV